MDDFALLGDAQAAVDRAARRCDDRARGLAAATADGAAAAVEEHDADAGVAGDVEHFDLHTLQRPARGDDAAVLAAVGIAEHDHLLIAARAQMLAIGRIGEQRRQGLWRQAQVLDRFEQRRDIERHVAVGVDEARAPRQRSTPSTSAALRAMLMM
jgi:hypothetical protein